MHTSIAVLAAEGGFNPLDLAAGGNFFWTLVIFLIALIPIWIVVMGPVTRALSARDAKVADAIAAAEKASLDAQNAKHAVEGKLKEAQLEAAKIVDAARARAEVVERDLKANAARESQAML